ncbi:MAG: hypothetical protein ABI862_05270 [Ilumatobacteraceae bacterium]
MIFSSNDAVLARLDTHPLYVVGGRQRSDRALLDTADSWYGYGLAVILKIDGAGVTTAFEYTSRPGSCGPQDAVLFKSATVVGDRFYGCTQTEVLVLSLPDFTEIAYISLPIFNDVHHVRPTQSGTLLVAISGLELVVEVTLEGEVLREWNVLGEDTWAVRRRNIDYRTGADLKPHRAHPNYLFFVDGEPFVTRFEMRDAISLNDPERRISIGGERVHDGVTHDGLIYFTTVDGCIVIVDSSTLQVVERHKLGRIPSGRDEGDGRLGWCRSVHIDGEWCWVGFSRIRPTRLRQTVSWVRAGGTQEAPTRISRYRLADWKCDAEINLEPFGLNAVFTVASA